MNNKFSIVIPTYNGELFIRDAIISALEQSRLADEILVVDDSSTDETLPICKGFDTKIKIITNHNGPIGYVSSFNRAINAASYDYVAILHQDDMLHKDFLLNAEEGIRIFPACKHIFSSYSYIDATYSKKQQIENTIRVNPVFIPGEQYALSYLDGVKHNHHLHRCPGTITHKEIFKAGVYFREAAGILTDDDFFYRIGAISNAIKLNAPLAYYRVHSASASGSLNKMELSKSLYKSYKFLETDEKVISIVGKDGVSFFHSIHLQMLFRTCYWGYISNDINAVNETANDYKHFLLKKNHGKANFHVLLYHLVLFLASKGYHKSAIIIVKCIRCVLRIFK